MSRIVKRFEEEPISEYERDEKLRNAWAGKIATYLAHCVDGGLLCSQFTLETLLHMAQAVTEGRDELLLKQEISYLLNVRKKGGRYDRVHCDPLPAQIKNSVNEEYVCNERVLVILIETGFIHKELSYLNPSEYPLFLRNLLETRTTSKLKEASCR